MSWVADNSVRECISCHYDGPNLGQIAAGQQSQLTAFSRRQELEFWLAKDKHTIARRRVEPFARDRNEQELIALMSKLDTQAKQAVKDYRNLGITIDETQIGLTEVPRQWIGDSNVLSRRICDKLGYDVDTAEGYAQFRDNCLTCHGGYQKGQAGFDFADKADAQIGISCLYCHQRGTDDRWVAAHAVRNPAENWRLLPPAEKAEMGMRDLVHTSNQANLCFDCHIGNRADNKFVSHEMYAAGHPPLPSIELQTFCQQMPQHWQTPSQLYASLSSYDKRDQYFTTNYPGVVAGADAATTFWNTRKMLLGALVARKKSLDLFADSSQPHQWADYSLYDCASCHHELQRQSQRQLRGFPAAPGRPRQHEWPAAIVDVALAFAGTDVQQLESELTGKLGWQPFGDPADVVPVINSLQAQLERAIEAAESRPIDEATARSLLQKLASTPPEKLFTYDSARQLAWAMHVIADELNDQQLIERLRNSGLELQLPAGRELFIYPDYLQGDLQRRATFDPADFARRIGK